MATLKPFSIAGLAAIGFLAISQVQAASIGYFLDQSNALPDGQNYLQVTLSDGEFGAIDVLVEVLDPLWSSAAGNFGIQKFGFNFSGSMEITDANIVGLPDGWSISRGERQMSGFGRYDVVLKGTGNSRQTTLSFSITGIEGATLADFAQLAMGNTVQGPSFFAAHVAGISGVSKKEEISSGFFGGLTPVPLPPALWMLITAVLGLAAHRLRGRARSAA